MDLLAAMQAANVEQIVAVNDPATGLLGFIMLHDTGRGPGSGEPTGAVADRLAQAALIRPRSTEKMWWPVR